MTVTGRSPEEGKGEIKLDLNFEGEPVEIRFNPDFITDALAAIDSDEITIEMKESSSPAVIKDGAGFLYVVMPIHIV